jgi:hypothetical protein
MGFVEESEPMPEEVIQAIMQQHNKRTGKKFTREEAEAIVNSTEHKRGMKLARELQLKHSRKGPI